MSSTERCPCNLGCCNANNYVNVKWHVLLRGAVLWIGGMGLLGKRNVHFSRRGSSALPPAKGLWIGSKVQKWGEMAADENCWQRKSRIHPGGVSASFSPVVFALEGSKGKPCWPEWDTLGGSRADASPALPPPFLPLLQEVLWGILKSGRKGRAGFGLLFSPQS